MSNIKVPILAEVSFEAVVTRADGTVENLGVVAHKRTKFLFWKRLLRWARGGGF